MYIVQNGYFTEVNGVHVQSVPVPGMQTPTQPKGTTYLSPGGLPFGIVFHYTVGCNNDISGTLASNAFGGAQFNVGQDGSIRQYAPLTVATYHCFHESHFYFGIEHTAYPGHGCELNDKQLLASAKLSAALIDWLDAKAGIVVPTTHFPNSRTNDYRAGFHDHRDFDGDGENSHTDHLYNWTWDKYLATVDIFKGDDMTDAEKKQLAQHDAMLSAIMNGLAAVTFAGAGGQVAKAVNEVQAGHDHDTGPSVPTPSGGGPRIHRHGRTTRA